MYGISNQLLQRCCSWKRSNNQQLQRSNVLNGETPKPYQTSFGFAIGVPKKEISTPVSGSVNEGSGSDFATETTPLTSKLEPSTP